MKNKRIVFLIAIIVISVIALLIICVSILLGITIFNRSLGSSQEKNTPEHQSQFPPAIPGLTYGELQNYLEEIMIDCGPMRSDAISYSAKCEGYVVDVRASIYIEVFSTNNPDEIYLILASVSQDNIMPSDEVSGRILGYIAAVPYTNADQSTAYNWVTNHISDNRSTRTIISGINYHLPSSYPEMRILAIGQSMDN